MDWFDDQKQNDFKADFGFSSPHRTQSKCKNPVFADHYLHRIAIMKDYHIGSKNDVDENGLPGWVSKFICTGCGKKYTINKMTGYFHPDSSVTTKDQLIKALVDGVEKLTGEKVISVSGHFTPNVITTKDLQDADETEAQKRKRWNLKH